MDIVKSNIANALTSAAKDHVLGVANDIYDENLGKYQSEINTENKESIAEIPKIKIFKLSDTDNTELIEYWNNNNNNENIVIHFVDQWGQEKYLSIVQGNELNIFSEVYVNINRELKQVKVTTNGYAINHLYLHNNSITNIGYNKLSIELQSQLDAIPNLKVFTVTNDSDNTELIEYCKNNEYGNVIIVYTNPDNKVYLNRTYCVYRVDINSNTIVTNPTFNDNQTYGFVSLIIYNNKVIEKSYSFNGSGIKDKTIGLAKLHSPIQDSINNADVHILDKNNPHEVTAEQIGLGTIKDDLNETNTKIDNLKNTHEADLVAIRNAISNNINEPIDTSVNKLKALGDNYKSLYHVANTLKNFLEAADTADEAINRWKEIETFLSGITDTQTLTGLLEELKTELNNKITESNNNTKIKDIDGITLIKDENGVASVNINSEYYGTNNNINNNSSSSVNTCLQINDGKLIAYNRTNVYDASRNIDKTANNLVQEKALAKHLNEIKALTDTIPNIKIFDCRTQNGIDKVCDYLNNNDDFSNVFVIYEDSNNSTYIFNVCYRKEVNGLWHYYTDTKFYNNNNNNNNNNITLYIQPDNKIINWQYVKYNGDIIEIGTLRTDALDPNIVNQLDSIPDIKVFNIKYTNTDFSELISYCTQTDIDLSKVILIIEFELINNQYNNTNRVITGINKFENNTIYTNLFTCNYDSTTDNSEIKRALITNDSITFRHGAISINCIKNLNDNNFSNKVKAKLNQIRIYDITSTSDNTAIFEDYNNNPNDIYIRFSINHTKGIITYTLKVISKDKNNKLITEPYINVYNKDVSYIIIDYNGIGHAAYYLDDCVRNISYESLDDTLQNKINNIPNLKIFKVDTDSVFNDNIFNYCRNNGINNVILFIYNEALNKYYGIRTIDSFDGYNIKTNILPITGNSIETNGKCNYFVINSNSVTEYTILINGNNINNKSITKVKLADEVFNTINTNIDTKIAEVVANAPEDFDTLKEIADWIAEHPEDTTAMNTKIIENSNAIATINNLLQPFKYVKRLDNSLSIDSDGIFKVNYNIYEVGNIRNETFNGSPVRMKLETDSDGSIGYNVFTYVYDGNRALNNNSNLVQEKGLKHVIDNLTATNEEVESILNNI